MNNTITGADEDGDSLIEVSYEKEDAQSVGELEDILDNLREQDDDD